MDEDIKLLEFRSNLILDAHLGDIELQLEQLEEDYKIQKR